MTFFFDANMSPKAARLLKAFGFRHQVISHFDKFPHNVNDNTWITEVSAWRPKPIIVSGDGRILTNPAERQVLDDVGLRFLLLTGKWLRLSWDEQAWRLVKIWPSVCKQFHESQHPKHLRVTLTPLRICGIRT